MKRFKPLPKPKRKPRREVFHPNTLADAVNWAADHGYALRDVYCGSTGYDNAEMFVDVGMTDEEYTALLAEWREMNAQDRAQWHADRLNEVAAAEATVARLKTKIKEIQAVLPKKLARGVQDINE